MLNILFWVAFNLSVSASSYFEDQGLGKVLKISKSKNPEMITVEMEENNPHGKNGIVKAEFDKKDEGRIKVGEIITYKTVSVCDENDCSSSYTFISSKKMNPVEIVCDGEAKVLKVHKMKVDLLVVSSKNEKCFFKQVPKQTAEFSGMDLKSISEGKIIKFRQVSTCDEIGCSGAVWRIAE